MAELLNTDSLESSLSAAFGGAELPKAEPAPEPEAPAVEAEAPVDGETEAVAEAEDAPEVEAAPVDEPEFEIEVDGAREVVKGADRVKELLQKGLHYGKNSESVAREREALVASTKQQHVVQQIQQALAGDVTELRALDQQLEQWNKLDLASMFESDPFQALKLKEQRDQLREARAAKFGEFQQKAQQADQAFQSANHQRLAAEEQALIAKLPEWRNSERARADVAKINTWLQAQGYSKTEADNVGDHRHMLLARKAYLYDQLMAGKDAKVKQVRTAPQVVKPGAVANQTNGRTDFAKARAKLREFGTKGNHKAQENLAAQMFEKAFK